MEVGQIPLCRTEGGCPIYELASSLEIKELIEGYFSWRRMSNAKIPEFLQLKCLRESGILEIGYDLLIELDSVYLDYLDVTREEQQAKADAKKAVNEIKKGYSAQ